MTPPAAEDWKLNFEEALAKGSVIQMIKSFQSQATAHAGTANAKVKTTAIKMLKRHYSLRRDDLFQVALELCQSGDATAEEVGVHLLPECYVNHPDTVVSVLHNLADSPNWEVREWVAGACGSILEQHFALFYPTIRTWAGDESDNVRRAVVLAVMYAGKSRKPEFAEPILEVVEVLLSDHSQYVRDNLGPFSLGSGLIKYYPEQVVERLHRWVQSEDEQMRWNLAMLFSAADGAEYAVDAKNVLNTLRSDERPYVQRAVAKAMKNIDKR